MKMTMRPEAATQGKEALVSALQINDNAILTIKHGDALLWSGVAECLIEGDYADVILGKRRIHCKIENRNENQGIVGYVKGQRRFTWSGRVVRICRCRPAKTRDEGEAGKKP